MVLNASQQIDSRRPYTSLSRLKMAMNGGRPPAMTPLTPAAKQVLDPEATLGMGGFVEDENKGLLCPVRGCGEYTHLLTRHLNDKHRAIGGAPSVREALSIPDEVRLVSQRHGDNLSTKARRSYENPKRKSETLRQLGKARPKGLQRVTLNKQPKKHSGRSIHELNLRNSCEAQLIDALLEQKRNLGRWPVAEEMGELPFEADLYLVFGLPSSALSQARLSVEPERCGRNDVYDAFEGFVSARGRTPTLEDALDRSTFPLLPRPEDVLEILGSSSWSIAMDEVREAIATRESRQAKGPDLAGKVLGNARKGSRS